MVFHNWMQPGLRLLTLLLALFSFQVAVEGWIFPKQDIKITIPEDYPLNVPFYRVSVIRSQEDIAQNKTVKFKIIKMDPSSRGENEAYAVKRGNFVKLDQSTGLLSLISEIPMTVRSRIILKKLKGHLSGRKRHKYFLNITLQPQNVKPANESTISIEFSGSMADYCTPHRHLCFPEKKTDYSILENSAVNQNVDFFMNPGLPFVCPNVTLKYNTISEDDFVSVNNVTGELVLTSNLDAEEREHVTFRTACDVGNKSFMMEGKINIIDVNDNAPTAENGNSSQQVMKIVPPNTRDYKFQVRVIDKDGKDLNELSVTIEKDPMKIFRAKVLPPYEKFGFGVDKKTLYFIEISTENISKHNFTHYNFTIVVEDKALKKTDNKVTIEVYLIKEYQTFTVKDRYEVNVSRRASKYARVLQISPIPLKNSSFRFSKRRKGDWLDITSRSGIVFVLDPLLMTNKSREQRKIIWKKNETQEEISSILIINIDEGSPLSCNHSYWCNNHRWKDECLESCGLGSAVGLCSWREEPFGVYGPSSRFAGCSPDFTTCPDNECDELEEMDPKICPFDCAEIVLGTGKMDGSKRGIGKARGYCDCSSPEFCICRQLPENLRIFNDNAAIEVKNISVNDVGKRFEDETSTPVMVPVTGFFPNGECDTSCVLLASMAPCGILLLVVTVFAVRKYRGKPMSHLKVGGSRISLSAVPSDYVQERPNSVQDSRTTTSEASCASKTVLDPKWEFPRNRLQFQTILGEGEFGKVVKAQASNINGMKGLTTVAVKMLKENGGVEEMQDLISEFTLMKDISHPNVIKLLGACTEKGGPFYLIVEYAEMGSLRSYLRRRRKHNNCCKYNATYGIPDVSAQPPREYYQFLCERSRYEPRHCFFHKEQLSFAWQTAKGMSYLADMKLVHRDLAARNILLDKRKVAKISDFGLSRDVYKGEAYLKKTKGRVPVKWLAIESLEDQIYTSRSDVWSFGIVMWEIMMQGSTPYPGVTPQGLFNLLKAGYRMSKPEYCPDELYAIMRLCWRKAPHERPSFKELVQKLETLLHDTVEYMDLGLKHQQTNFKVLDGPLLSFGEPTSSSIQYTSVLIDNEEEFSDEESPENIGLVNLFNEVETAETSRASSDRESTT